jgi:hypothetical protein
MSSLSTFKQNLINLPGWHTKRKLVVFESDDWGSIRVSSKDAYNKFLSLGIPVNSCPYNSNDALETNEDIHKLASTLKQYKDSKGHHPIITMNSLTANPDFEKIKSTNYRSYFFEPSIETLSKNTKSNNVRSLILEGISEGYFKPQLHGREHVQINNWLKSLQKQDVSSLTAFEEKMFSVSRGIGSTCKKENLDGFGCYEPKELQELKNILADAAEMFKTNWGYTSKSIIAPCYIWRTEAEHYFKEIGVTYIQSGRVQTVTNFNDKPNTFIRHYTGQRNSLNQIYTIRNAVFEPSSNHEINWVMNCLNDIEVAFRWRKPAIICAHRVNFVGSINPHNRDNNLKLLSELLNRIVQKWPEVEFVSSDELGDIISLN